MLATGAAPVFPSVEGVVGADGVPLPGVTATLVADALRDAKGTLAWRGERPALAEALAGFVRAGDVVLTIGAGDITRTGPELLDRLRARG